MDIEWLLEKIADTAAENSMDAYIVGVGSYVLHDEYIPDGRLLKLCPKGIKTRVLLELDVWRNSARIHKHRDYELTEEYRGQSVSLEWITGFIRANRAMAEEIILEYDRRALAARVVTPFTSADHLSPEDISAKQMERHQVACACNGMNENCARCLGNGRYIVDGFGNIV